MSEMTTGSFILKTEFSPVRTLHVQFKIDWPSKTIEVQMQTNGGKELLNPDGLVMLSKAILPERYGITAYDTVVEENHRPVVSTWQVILNFAGQQLPVRLIRDLLGHITTEIATPIRKNEIPTQQGTSDADRI